MRTSVTWRVITACLTCWALPAAADEQPLHQLIDERMRPVAGVKAERASDAEFLRRVSLDIIGMPPQADEAREFIADPAPDKRERLIDRLFASPHYARRLASALDLMLMERRANTHVSADEWQAWLVKSVRENKPWNVLVREILEADGEDPATRPAARFILDRGSDPHLLTRDIGRIFFGRDLQCAQCHDHPLVGDYLQSDYHGLLAFLTPSYPLVRTVDGGQKTVLAERAGTDLNFTSVFVGTPRRTGPRAPEETVIDEPLLLPGEEYDVAPADNVASKPKFSRRKKLAEQATDGSNAAFNVNMANRLWAHMFGRGLVHPVDMHHSDNPAIDPDLLRALGERFAAMNFDMRAFLREIALSETYQRAFDPPKNVLSVADRAKAEAEKLKKERAARKAAMEATSEAYAAAAEAWEEAEAALVPVATEYDTARTEYAQAKANLDAAVQAKTAATNQLTAKQAARPPVEKAAEAAKAATAALPEDKELAEAAQKFVARAEQLATEITELAKAVEEKTAALPPLEQGFAAVKPKMETAVEKVLPLSGAWKEREKPMLAARLRAATDAEALIALNRRLKTARLLARLPELKQAVAAAEELVAAREAQVAAAEKQLRDHVAAQPSREVAAEQARDALTAATARLKAARNEHAALVATAEAMAIAATEEDQAAADQADAKRKEAIESQKRCDAEAAALQAAAEASAAAEKALADAAAEQRRRAEAVESARKALTAARAEVKEKKAAFAAVESELMDRWSQDFTIAPLKALTPEQLCWAVLRVTGVYDRQWQAEAAELDKAAPLAPEDKADPVKLLARSVDLEQRTYDKLKPNIGTFVAFYGAAPGQPQGDFFSTADQALFAANGGAFNSWAAPNADNVTERIIKRENAREAAEELYLAVLTRPPTESEATDVVQYLNRRASDKAAAAQELVWALLNSAEFRFNH